MDTNQLDKTRGPVVINNADKMGYADPVAGLNNMGIQRLQKDVGDTNRDVKDAESHVIAKLGDARYENARSEAAEITATKDVTKDLLQYLNTQRNAADAQFLALNNRLCESEKTTMDVKTEVIKQGYEARLTAKDAIIDSASRFQHLSERLSDKAEHYYEEITEKLCECCGETNKALALIGAALKITV